MPRDKNSQISFVCGQFSPELEFSIYLYLSIYLSIYVCVYVSVLCVFGPQTFI